MRTVYDLYHWPTEDTVTAERPHPTQDTLEAAREAAGLPHPDRWRRTRDDSGWHSGFGRAGWLIAERQEPETDAERVQLTIELLIDDGQVDGDHHKAWVIDQALRLLAGDRYEQAVTDYCTGEDGPDTYDWDEGIAP